MYGYLLRHSFVSDLRAAGVPEYIIQKFMGHKPGSAVTQVYGSPSDDILLESIVTRKYKEWTKVRKLVRKNNANIKKPHIYAIFESLSGGDDGTWTHTVLPPPDFKSDASADSATSPYPL